jgi:hypothetical protein
MGTAQAYIQGLEQGGINKNCTFIPITAYPISTTGPNPDGSFNYTRIITYQALDGTTYTIKITYQAFLSMKPPKIFISAWKGPPSNPKVEYAIELTMNAGNLVCYFAEYILLLPVDKISIVVNIMSLGYDIYTQNWVMACIDAAILFVSLGVGQSVLAWIFAKIGIEMAVLSTLVGVTAFLGALIAAFFIGYFVGKLIGLNEVGSILLGLGFVIGFIIIIILI